MNPKIFMFLGLLGVSIALLIIALAVPLSILPSPIKILILALSLLFDILAFSSRHYSYIIMPALQQRSKRIVLSNEEPYWMSTSEDSIIKREKGYFIASVYISIPIYRSATEMTDLEKVDFSRQASKLIGVSRDPVRFTTEMYLMNKDAYLQILRDAISAAENDQARLMQQKSTDPEELDMVKGKLAMWKNIFDNVSKVQSLELTSYVTVSAEGLKEYEAVSLAQQKAREMMSGIASILGVTPSIITGKDILKFVEPEYLIPFSTITEQINKNIEEEVI
jgi:hypothetical protein